MSGLEQTGQTRRHTITLIILVDDKPVTQGEVVGDELDAMLLCAHVMKQRAMIAGEEIGVAIDRLRDRYDAEDPESEDDENKAADPVAERTVVADED